MRSSPGGGVLYMKDRKKDVYVIKLTSPTVLTSGTIHNFHLQKLAYDEIAQIYRPVFTKFVPIELRIDQYFSQPGGTSLPYGFIAHLIDRPNSFFAESDPILSILTSDHDLMFRYDPIERLGCLMSYSFSFARIDDAPLQPRWITAIHQQRPGGPTPLF